MPKAVPPKAALSDHAVVFEFLLRGQGWSQAELSRVSGIPPARLNDYEKGRRTLTRGRLDHLARVLGLPRERVDATLDCLARNRAAAAAPAGTDSRAAIRYRIEALADQAGRMERDHALALLTFLTDEGEALVARQQAEQLLARLKRRTAAQRRVLVEKTMEFRSWALAEAAALESVHLAPNHPRQALEWAELAVRIAELVPGEDTWRWRLQGWTLHVLANALRACNDLPAAEKALLRGRALWEAGAPGDRGLLAEAWLPWIEANLLKDQRRLPEARQRIDAALTLDEGELRGEILLSKSNILRRMDDPEGSTAVLLEAETLIDARREPRLALVLRFNLLVDLCFLGKAAAAEPRLPVVQALAERLGEPLDLTRCLWLQGLAHAGLGRHEEALAAFRQVQRTFREHPLAYDCALVSLDLSLVLLEQGRTAEVAELAAEMVWIFKAQGVHQQAMAALRVFCAAAEREAATVEQTRRIVRFLRRAELDPELRFEDEGAGTR